MSDENGMERIARLHHAVQRKRQAEGEYQATHAYQTVRSGLEPKLMESIDAAESHTGNSYIHLILPTWLVPRDHILKGGERIPVDSDEFEIIVRVPTILDKDFYFDDFTPPHDNIAIAVYEESHKKMFGGKKLAEEGHQYVAIHPQDNPITNITQFNSTVPKIIDTANAIYKYLEQRGLSQMYGKDATVIHLFGGKK